MTTENYALPAINYSDRKTIEMLKNTVAQGATDEEFAMFAELCKSSGLNPFKREVWFVKAGGRAQIMTGINGYLAIANRHPQFDGMEVTFEYAADKLKSATCKVYRKDRKFPSVATARIEEWVKPTPIWKEKPSVMLGKVAKSIAIREAFSLELAGTYTEEEMPPSYSIQQTPTASAPAAKLLTADQVEERKGPIQLYVYTLEGMSDEQIPNALEYLQANGAYESEVPGCWYSERPLKKMQKYLVDKTPAESVAA